MKKNTQTSYRKKVIQSLTESNCEASKEPLEDTVEDTVEEKETEYKVLKNVAESLFSEDGDDLELPDDNGIDHIEDEIQSLDDVIEDPIDMPSEDVVGDQLDQPAPMEQPIDNIPSNASIEDLTDLATDTVHEALVFLKELRDKFKEENPNKAQIIRNLYDYILKGKEKIAADMLKDVQQSNQPDNNM